MPASDYTDYHKLNCLLRITLIAQPAPLYAGNEYNEYLLTKFVT
jgi:hypothetical protein